MARHNGSRVHRNQKYMNTSKHRGRETNPSKVTRRYERVPDYHEATSLTTWLLVKYGMTYKQFRNKSAANRHTLRAEYTEDTGLEIRDGGDQRLPPTDVDFADDFCGIDDSMLDE